MESSTKNASDSTPPTQPTRFKWKWIFYGIVALAYLPQLPGCLTAHASKFGRVVDADTGKGMAGIAVIASADISTSAGAPFFPETLSRFTTEYRVAVITDRDGTYWIPSTWLDLDIVNFLPLFGDFQQTWHLVAFKPGYVMVSDEQVWQHENLYSRASGIMPYTPQLSKPFITSWFGFIAGLSPIQLRAKQLPFNDAIRYYSTIRRMGPDNASLWADLYKEALEHVCIPYSNLKINYELASGLGALVPNQDKYDDWIIKNTGDVNIWERALYKGYYFQPYDVCQAMKAGS